MAVHHNGKMKRKIYNTDKLKVKVTAFTRYFVINTSIWCKNPFLIANFDYHKGQKVKGRLIALFNLFCNIP